MTLKIMDIGRGPVNRDFTVAGRQMSGTISSTIISWNQEKIGVVHI